MHTEKYSPKSYVVNFHRQMSSSQSEERTMAFTRAKKDTSNQNREGCFLRWGKNVTSNQKPQRCVSFAPNFRLFLQVAATLPTNSTRKVFLEEFFLTKSENNFGNWCGMVSFVSLSLKKNVESGRNNSGRGKTEQDVSLCCAFYRSYFVFHLRLSLRF